MFNPKYFLIVFVVVALGATAAFARGKDLEMDHREAITYCAKEGKHLPSIDELSYFFRRGKLNGYQYYWSSSVVSNNSNNAYYLDGGNGGVGDDPHDYSNAVRCASGL